MYLYDYESAFEMWQRKNNIFDKKNSFKNRSDEFSKNATSAFCEILSIKIINKMNPCHLEFSIK